MSGNLSRLLIFSLTLISQLLVASRSLPADELHEILDRAQQNQNRFQNVRCVIQLTSGTVRRIEDAEDGPLLNTFDQSKNESLPEEKWTPATPSIAQLWIRRSDVERFEEQRFSPVVKEFNWRPNWSKPFGSSRVLGTTEKGVKIDLGLGTGGGGGGMWEESGRYSYNSPFDFQGVGASGKAFSLASLVKGVEERKYRATVEHRKGTSGEPRIDVFFQSSEDEQHQIATITYHLNPAHGMLPDEIRVVGSAATHSFEMRFLVKHAEIPGTGWFPMACTMIMQDDRYQDFKNVTRLGVVTSSFDRPADNELKVELPQNCILHLDGNFKTQFKLKESQTVDMRGVDNLIQLAKRKALEVE